MGKTLLTKWGRNLDPAHVLGEYPRPGLKRESCIILNGYWQYAITRSRAVPQHYEGRILVPFSPEAPLSGVNRQLLPGEYLHYGRELQIGQVSQRSRWILHFGAVDQWCEVFVNGKRAGDHLGGYLPFSFDITCFLHNGSNLLQVTVSDLSDTSFHAKGKQSLERGGMWYTAQSGIWQTVWMEEVPSDFIAGVKITPDFDHSMIRIKVLQNGERHTDTDRGLPVHTEISFQGKILCENDFQAGRTAKIRLREVHAWSPEDPALYDVKIRMGEDTVRSYFAMRKVDVQRDRKGILRFFLNNRPYYHNGLLDQGYYPDGLYTAPSDEAMICDIRTMKDLGFNMLRKHIKIEPERWYYHCDRLGMLVWQDMVCGGERYRSWFVTMMPNLQMWTGRVISDRNYTLFARKNAAGRREFQRELKETIRHLYNHPCIVAWVPFNEGWGQFDAARFSKLVRRLDPSRLIDEASGWFDQGGGDMYSIHNYWRRLGVRPQKNRVVALTECGGYSCFVPEHSFGDEVYGYRKYASGAALTEGIAGLWEKELIPGIPDGLSASVYTQVSDIEDEVNGLLTYDREILKPDAARMRALNGKLYRSFADASGEG